MIGHYRDLVMGSKGFFRDRFVCILSITSDTNLCCMETRSSSHATDAFQQNWSHKLLYAFPSFCIIPKVLNKTLKEKVPKLMLITPAWTTQVQHPKILNMSINSPILLPWRKDLLKNPKGEIHSLVQNRILKLVAWTVSERDCRRR